MNKNKYRKYQKQLKSKCKNISNKGMYVRCKFYRGFGIVELNNGILIDTYLENDELLINCINKIYHHFEADAKLLQHSVYIKGNPKMTWTSVEKIINEYF